MGTKVIFMKMEPIASIGTSLNANGSIDYFIGKETEKTNQSLPTPQPHGRREKSHGTSLRGGLKKYPFLGHTPKRRMRFPW